MKNIDFLISTALDVIKNHDILSAHLSAMSQLSDCIIASKTLLDLDGQVDFALNVKLMCNSIAKLREAEGLLLTAKQINK